MRRHACTGARPSRQGGGGGHVGVDPPVHVPHSAQVALQQHRVVGVQGPLDHLEPVRHVGPQPLGPCLARPPHRRRVEDGLAVHAFQVGVVAAQRHLELGREHLGVVQVGHAQAHPSHLVGVRGPDPLPGRAVGHRAPRFLFQDVKLHVVGQGEVRTVGDQELPAHEPLAGEFVHLLQQQLGVDHAARSDEVAAALVEDPGGHQVEPEGPPRVHDGVAGVGAAVEADHEPGVLAEGVDDLPLALVAPVQPHHRGDGHQPCAPTASSTRPPTSVR
ncbi:hypothetical protein HRbin32_02038 [bacterium HR32]|nr:hypothetical protein HRbin32_02038 [bacterium HR32]